MHYAELAEPQRILTTAIETWQPVALVSLFSGGYMWDFDNLNAADYGVPQTRRRLILRAIKGRLLPMLPQPERWISWYSAIEDLIPTLPESQFAAWQLARLPNGLTESSLVERHGAFNLQEEDGITVIDKNTPIFTVRASERAVEMATGFLVADEYGSPNNNGQERILFTRDIQEPAMSVKAQAKATVRAYLVGTNANDTSQAKIYQEANEPAQMVRTPSGGRETRALFLKNRIFGDTPEQQARLEESWQAAHSDKPRAWLSQGRVVSMTPRALARFQSFPDSYLLPDNKALACRVIGNAVPPLLYQKIIKPLVEAAR